MERIIKFKAQDENHCWHFGNYDQDNHEIFYTHIDADGCHRVHIPIVPSTVSEFTGFKDVDDVEIYEGDILQNYKCPDILPIVGMVNGCWTIDCPENEDEPELLYRVLAAIPFKVIGNIFDNPKLGGN